MHKGNCHEDLEMTQNAIIDKIHQMIDTFNVQNANPTTMKMRWRSKPPLDMIYIYAYEACK